MNKLFVFSAITLSSLFASVAFADEPVYPPCNGNYGITYPNRCTPTPPTPNIPDEAFAAAPDVVIEVAPLQAPERVQTPAQTPCAETSPVPPVYQPNRLGQSMGLGRFGAGSAQGKFGLFQSSTRVREVGARSMTGDGYGGSVYFRTHRNESRLGLELSVDAVDNVSLTQASIVAYSKYQGVIKPFAFVGGGAYIETPGFSFQAGVGADVNITQRLTLNVDARYLAAEEIGGNVSYQDCFDCFYSDNSFDGALFSMGLGWKFGALGKQEKTLLQGKLLGSTASLFKTSTMKGFSWPNQSKYTYSQRWNQPGIGWNSSKYVAAWNQPKTAGSRPGLFRPSASAGSSNFVREVGVRSFTDLNYGGEGGGGLYVKTYRDGGRLGGEASLDSIGSNLLAQGSLLGYLNPKGTIRPYGILGVGSELTSGNPTLQWGAGLDIAIAKHMSLSADLRGIEGSVADVPVTDGSLCIDYCYSSSSSFVGGFGVGYKF